MLNQFFKLTSLSFSVKESLSCSVETVKISALSSSCYTSNTTNMQLIYKDCNKNNHND
jgi:hypothetical protein